LNEAASFIHANGISVIARRSGRSNDNWRNARPIG